MASLSGQTVSHYTILQKLGEGGMGVVYKAEDLRLTRTVALKFLPHGLDAHEPERARFLQEARAAAILSHANICTVYDIQEHEGQQFIVMEYVEGKTLRKAIPVQKTQDVIGYAIQIAEALQEAHSNGIVHRDIKPENIMINSKNQVKVTDFGLAKLKGSLKLTKTSSTVGTLAYMAPEQIEGGEADTRSDIFSFGVVLYEMLTGHLPFKGEHEAATVYAIVNEDPEPVEKYRPDLSPVFVNLIQRALEKSPPDRYQSAEDMVIELKRLQRQTTKVARTASSVLEPSGGESAQLVGEEKGIRRSFLLGKRSAMIGAAILSTIVVVSGLYLLIFRRESPMIPSFPAQSTKLTLLSTSGNAKLAAVSPDGMYVVYSLEESGKQTLWVRQVATNSNVQIAPLLDVIYYGLTISRDGNYVFYTMHERTTGKSAVYQVPILGGTHRKLLDGVDSPVAFSPDNRQFTFVRYNPATGVSSLMVAKTDGSEPKEVRSETGGFWFSGRPAWSPDGKLIACPLGSLSAGAHYAVVAVRLEDAVEVHFTQHLWDFVYELFWLPDGSGLVLNAEDRGSIMLQMWYVSYPDGAAHRMTNDLLDYASPSLTADAQTLCVVQGDYRSSIWILSEGSAARAQRITHGRDAGIFGLAWSPEGRIVYRASVSGSPDLWVMDRNGKNQRQLTADTAFESSPVVSPDGKCILFVTDRTGAYNIWKMESDGSKQRQLTQGREDASPDISHDGKWFVYNSWDKGPQLIMKMPVEGGEPLQLAELSGHNPVISPDGRLVAYVHQDEQTRKPRIDVIDARGGQPLKEFELPPTFALWWGGVMQWSPDGLSLHYIDTRQGVSNIWDQPLAGGPPRQMTDFKSDYLFQFDWSPDGKYLAVVRYTVSSDVLLMSRVR
jgi:eukaryotic-like serine/threonine-protein kinase